MIEQREFISELFARAFDHVIIILLSFVSGLTTLIGVYLATLLGNSPKRISLGICFSAGIMLVISIMELLPRAKRTKRWIGPPK